MDNRLHDVQTRLAAVDYLKRASAGGVLTSDDLKRGFVFEGARVPLINPQRGIFKPAAMNYLLSVRTVYPVSGRKVWYDDQRQVHGQIERGDNLIDYAFMGSDPEIRRQSMAAGGTRRSGSNSLFPWGSTSALHVDLADIHR